MGIMLMEEEDKKAADTLCNTVTKLAITSKNADQILKAVKVVENTCLNNEVTIEELDKNLRSTIKMAVDNEQKLDERAGSWESRSLSLRGVLREQSSLRRTSRALRRNSRLLVRTSFPSRTSTRSLRPDLSMER